MPGSPRRDVNVPGSPSRSPSMAARGRNAGLNRSEKTSDSQHHKAQAHAHVHHHHHHHHEEMPHAKLILWTTLISTLIFFFIYFFLTIPLEAPDYPSSSGAGSYGKSNSSGHRLLDASQTM